MPQDRDRERHEGVGAEETERQKPAAEHGRGQPVPCSQRPGRQQPAEHWQAERQPGDRQRRAREHARQAEVPSARSRLARRGPDCQGQAAEHQSGTHGHADPVDQPVRLSFAGGRRLTAESHQGRNSHRPGQRDEGKQPEEDPAPAEVLGDLGAERGTGQPGRYPGRRQHGHHPCPEALGQAAPDRDVGHGGHGPGAKSLQRAAGDQHGHGRSEPRDGQPGGEHHDPGDVRDGWPALVGHPPGSDDADHGPEQERAEDEAVEAQPVQVPGDQGHHGHDRERLGGHERDRRRQPDGQ